MQTTTYEEVREETLDVLQELTDLVPNVEDVLVTPEFDPYPCGQDLALQGGKGAFFTGQWAVFVRDDFDIPQFISDVPRQLGDDWRIEELGIPVNFAEVYLVRNDPRMTLKIEEATIDGRPAIDLLAVSRCGAVAKQDGEASFPPPTPRIGPEVEQTAAAAGPPA
ncbi:MULTISPECIES: hypothetical protein [Microbacterium]|uniref:hypothetical protein n=1 Tax=Microbacterium TaxID=33882 RepID=UPI0027894643|nr:MULTISPECIES: hypothetical protein [Microbacterium]MDQ1083821.1 hypothetical protein [Microbacterium sp. SORGH_AS_0344]MDQ1170900.1 hypothetical protein [Microbacterium proteolyticum]